MPRADLHVSIVLKSGSLKLLEPSGPVQACNGTALTLQLTLVDDREIWHIQIQQCRNY